MHRTSAPPGQLSPPVLYFHSVAPRTFDNWIQQFLTFPLAEFEEQLAYLKAHGYRAVFLDEWLEYRMGHKKVSGREVCVAFDDGLLDNWVYALPIARKYGMRFTLFVSPECVAPGDAIRPTLEDVWSGHCREDRLEGLGYLNWSEIKAMQDSGWVDIQSHTMTHAKYPVSSRITGFYYGGFPGLHPTLNAWPELRPVYMNTPDFEQRLPKGTPLFEERSAVVARRVTINPAFLEEAAQLAAYYENGKPELPPAYEQAVMELRDAFDHRGQLILATESEQEYQARLHYEVVESKNILERRLGKPVRFLCWPHGDNNPEAHQLALKNGYAATTAGKMTGEKDRQDRIPRFGTVWNHGPWLNRQKFHYKLASHYHKQPYYAIWMLNEYKNSILGRN